DEALHTAVASFRLNLPESYLFLLVTAAHFAEAYEKFSSDIYDCMPLPLESPLQLFRSVDHAAKEIYLLYQNEQLLARLKKIDIESEQEAVLDEETQGAFLEAPSLFFQSWLERLYSQPHLDHAVQLLLEGMASIDKDIKAIYFKYIPHRRTLMAAQWLRFEEKRAKSVGLSFNDLDPQFQSDTLRQPEKVRLLGELASYLAEFEQYQWKCHTLLGDIRGLLLLTSPQRSFDFSGAERFFSAFSKHCELLELEKRLHSNTFQDVSTGALNKTTFHRRFNDEISRARRLQLPVSLLLIALDQFRELQENYGDEEVEVIMRSLARILSKHSRVNDLTGRFAPDQFAIVLPHTAISGALIKAERLRKLVELADFSKILRNMGKLTVSIGVGEYPSVASDGEELMQNIDEHLYQLRTETQNKIVKVQPKPGFQADFEVENEGAS
ncbi:MAG: GGDEF domain-containing protein, partial [Bdellovibrionales bacterium]|nr:GGDEF domain-containing protein [Bdellovibrionales bacterium]